MPKRHKEKKVPRKHENKPRPPAASFCRECGEKHVIPRYEFFKANKPRCARCGGLLDYGGKWYGTR